MTGKVATDGVKALVPRERMSESARRLRDTYAMTPDLRLFRREFGYFCLDRWYEQGLPRQADLAEQFTYDTPGNHHLSGAGWCEAAFTPAFDEAVIEQRGDHEVIRDAAGRHVKVFRGRRSGFMPEYVDHPVKDMRSWEANCLWRLDPDTPERWTNLDRDMAAAREAAGHGLMISQCVVGGYMYLRSLIGPTELLLAVYDMPELIHECMRTWLALADAVTARHQQRVTLDEIFFGEDICYNHGPLISQCVVGGYMYLRSLIGPTEVLLAVYDMPELIHECMRTWLALADAVTARHQQHVTLDEIFFGEDICYNHGPLISPKMVDTFLFPYYQQLIANTRARQIDKSRHLYVHVDTDGFVTPVIPLYQRAIGMDVMSPFEVAAGCDVVQISRQFPDLVVFGGIDKRVLAKGPKAIDKHLEYVIPAMRRRGGYIPTCDHGVPEEVSLENYRYYRKRCIDLGG